ncbi:hypothetical protein WICMUC_003022 [Wickerhamomyces mucosus]|uniref:Uncharacterized protein n=1 Tax=Wickerhamomyces mucosus TaxID=1378264 RepID=A0A9P8PP88_9ASCO|nr:hypothetical protein WICMUC_003022 [Wickerhamomyces mucosus]
MTSDQVEFNKDFVCSLQAKYHVVNDKSLLDGPTVPCKVEIWAVGQDEWEDEPRYATEAGSITLGELFITGVLYLPDAPKNVISLLQLELQGYQNGFLYEVELKDELYHITDPASGHKVKFDIEHEQFQEFDLAEVYTQIEIHKQRFEKFLDSDYY